MKYEVYKIQNKITNKIYIGITTQGYQKRFRKHLKEVEAGSTFILHNAIRSYGKENFSSNLLEEVNSIEQLKEREKFWIKALDTTNRDKGYNMTEGGDGTFGRLHSDETKAKISEITSNSKYKRRLSVTIENILTQEVNIYKSSLDGSLALGKNRLYLSELRGRKHGADIIFIGDYKITFIKTGKQVLKKDRIIDPNKMKNLQQRSKEVRAANPEYYNAIAKKAQESKRKVVLQLDFNGNIVNEYVSRAEAVELSGLSKTGIAHALKGRKADYKGYIWKYKE